MRRHTHDEELAIVRQWMRAGPALAAQRQAELRQRPYDWMTVDALLDMGARFGRRHARSLLREQGPPPGDRVQLRVTGQTAHQWGGTMAGNPKAR